MTITTAVSPDCGLDTLDRFLAATKSSLVIGMYDFTSGPILDTFGKVLKGGRTLQMVLDNPALNPTASQSDPETVQTLQGELGGRFHFEWALERNERHVNAWEFPSAYHIKVIVRDGTATWLSSGILNNSNEPDLDAPPKPKIAIGMSSSRTRRSPRLSQPSSSTTFRSPASTRPRLLTMCSPRSGDRC
jgi:hypothetical protein